MNTPQIIATVGPASLDILQELQDAGVSVFRLNFSHGDRDWHKKAVEKLRALKNPTKIMIDTKGPEIRTGDLHTPITLTKGDRLTLINKKTAQNEKNKLVYCSYEALPTSVQEGDNIVFDNGQFTGKVVSVHQSSVAVEIENDGILGARRHINLPGVRVQLPTISKDDEEALLFAKEHGNMVALSFARTARDITKAQEIAGENVEIVAKIENQEGLENFKSIARTANGVMIARGDLGVEVPLEHIPVLQRKILRQMKDIEKSFSVVATGLLRSMKTENRPHRAEVTDIATATWEEADYLMLSDETAAGKYPVLAVETLKKVADFAAEHSI